MSNQASSALVPSNLDAGNAVLYYAPSPFSSLAAAVASTAWRKFGLIGEGVNFKLGTTELKFYSGVPSGLVKKYYTSQEVMLSGKLLETEPRKLAMLMGGQTITETVHASSPAPTVVATGSTKSVVAVASVTGYAVGDEIRVGNVGSYQYGTISSINTSMDEFILYEGLSGDTIPTIGHAVAKINRAYFPVDNLTAPTDIAIKLSKTTIGGYGSYDLYLLKAQITPNVDVNYNDNTQTPEAIGVPFTLEGIKDPAVENGTISFWDWHQS